MRFLALSAGLALGLLGCSSGPERDGAQQVRIVRDNYGVPHIYADDRYGLYFGYGYAVAQDRLFQMEMARRSTQGQVAEVLGPDYADYDKGARLLFDPASIRRQLASLPAKDIAVFDGYADGLNAWLAEVAAASERLTPRQFGDFGFSPTPWTPYDVVMVFVGTMNNRYGSFNTELENAAILREFVSMHGEEKAMRLFNQINPHFTQNAPITIPRTDWSRPAYDAPASRPPDFAPVLADIPRSAAVSGMSNCYVLGPEKLSGAASVLVNGPQFGWFNPAYVYSVGLHGGGIDVVGNTPFGYPVVMFGHNRTIAWGSTWGASDIVDLYAEQLHPETRPNTCTKAPTGHSNAVWRPSG